MSEHGIVPQGWRVVVLPDKVKTETESGIVISTGSQTMREEMAQVDGIVVAMGSECYNKHETPWCKIGDKVIFGKYSGIFRKGNDGKTYRIINDEDVVATLEGETV